MGKDAFERELMKRSPLATAALETCDFMIGDELLNSIWNQCRGRCYEDVLQFGDFLRLMREALLVHGGSAHKLFVDLEQKNVCPIDDSNFYRKLSRMPVALSRALLSGCTQRLTHLLPVGPVTLPCCFDDFEVVIGDGKKIKNVTKRLKPARGYSGQLLGAKALVALDARRGLAIAMSDSLDGMTNDVPLVPLLMPQLYEIMGERPMLSIWDRQFDDVKTLQLLSQRSQDAFLVRMAQKQTKFVAESSEESRDAQGRRVLDEIGMLGRGKKQMRVRRVTLFRNTAEGEEDVVLLSNLLQRDRYSAADLLELYRHRWKIEQAFQQVTETFSLEHLIGCSPKATLFQFSFCLLLYNLMQVVKAYVADDGKVLATAVSMFYLFDDVRKELEAWAYHTDGHWPRVKRDAATMQERLRELLKGSWKPIKYRKRSDAKPRGKPKPKLRLHGGHSSMQRAIEGRARVVAA